MTEITTDRTEIDSLQIPELEKTNLNNLFGLLMKKSVESKDLIKLNIVGGVLNKPWPRKDIDVTIEIKGENGNTELEKANKEYQKILKLVMEVEIESSGFFKISKKIFPYADHEFNNDNILAHDGSVEIKPREGTSIELIKKRRK